MSHSTTTGRRSVFSRPSAETGFSSWITTTDHKKIGIMYFFTVLVFFFLGGVESGLIRAQLAQAEQSLVTAEIYNQAFTMHGITMVFLVVMPLSAAFFNYLIPLQIGARDVAFPRLNAFSYWMYLFGGIFLYSSFLLGGAPNGSWVGYAPLSVDSVSNMAFYAVGLQLLGVSSLSAAVNFITTILNMRAPGMTFMRMPMFIWMSLVTNFLLLFALPIIAVALFMLQFDTVFGAQFFNPATGGDPILWQHLFWLFGHPEVYIMILPAMGIVSEILPVFSRKPLFGYAAVAFAGAAIGFIGFGVWAHHMFTSSIGPVARSAFALSTMFIAVPTGIKIFNWVFTMWGGKLRFTTPMLFSIGFVSMFTIGGLSGVTHSIVPHNAQQHDTYYVVAHFHYVLFGGALFGLIAGIYYWFPKVTGRLMSEKLGKVHFWTWLLGFNLTFGPMHMSGLLGQPRRTAILPGELGATVELYNLLSTAGLLVLVVSALLFLYNLLTSIKSGVASGPDPWDARTLEWLSASPPKVHNFDAIPNVSHRDEFWHRKYAEDESGRPVAVPAGASHDHVADADDRVAAAGDGTDAAHDGHDGGEHIHMPDPSYWPLVMCLGFFPMAYGLIGPTPWLIAIGLVWVVVGYFGWIIEPVAEGDDDDPIVEDPAAPRSGVAAH
ncbi:cytochrome c oxidase subunit I [Egicoccus halophilus]|uniref:Cytochrome c oxidase subunit 1 n=1 Tax=Egicoccus halophilus TaxID=1670830 RepID=A0A8J3EV93_9ACTN|nr:cytochrome c oxidase subunit I [Egicoccus halophilus]GGI07654.1 cytochrome c oxidase subunit 1 [Egicoccus halophilus]